MSIKLVAATSLKVGGFMIMEGVPSRVSSIDVSRPGKHGHAKCRIEAIGLLDDVKRIKIFPGHDKIEVPIIEKGTAQVVAVMGNIIQLMDTNSYASFTSDLPSELKGLKSGDEVEYIKYGENAKVLRKKPVE